MSVLLRCVGVCEMFLLRMLSIAFFMATFYFSTKIVITKTDLYENVVVLS